MPAKRRRPSRKHIPSKKAIPKGIPSERKNTHPKDIPVKRPAPKRKGTGRLRGVFSRRFILFGLLSIAALAFFIRCLHLFDPGHYYIISADSYLFHWMADRVMDGQSIPTNIQPSGLAYPLAYIATTIGHVFSMSDQDALTFVSKYLPPFIGVLTAVLIYLGLSRMYDRRTGLCCAVAWAVLPHAYFIQAAGYLDRDGINVSLILIGALAFFFSRRWRLNIKGWDLGWVFGVVVVLILSLIHI